MGEPTKKIPKVSRAEAARTGNKYWEMSDYLKTINQELLKRGVTSWDARRKAVAKKYSIPFNKEKAITLRKGRFNTGITTTDILEEIAKAAEATNTPLDIALGLIGRESGLGYARNFKENGYITMSDLTSNWLLIIKAELVPNSLWKLYKTVLDKYKNEEFITEEDLQIYKKAIDMFRREEDNVVEPMENPIINALNLYKKGKYNPGDKNYTNKVLLDAKVLMSDPAIINYYTKTARLKEPEDVYDPLPIVEVEPFMLDEDGNFKANGGFIPSLQDNEASQIKYQSHTNNIPSVRYDDGGNIEEEDPENNHWHSTRIDVKNDKLRLWMNNWLTDRQLLIGKNYAEGTPWYEYPFKDVFRKNEDIIKEDSAKLLLKQLNNLDNVIEYTPFHGNIANPVTEANRLDLTLKLPLTSREALTLPLEELARKLFLTKNGYSPVTNNNIYYDTYKSIHNNNPTIHNDTVIHERTHNLANEYTPQEYYIDTQLLPTKNLIEGELFNSYLDKANEIYARLNEFRYINKLKSDQKITLLDLNKWRESGKLDYHDLERYNDNFLLHLFNDVAIDTTNFFDRGENKYLASNGGQLKKYDTLSMRERAQIIRVGVTNGLRNILSIRDRYNEFVQS